MPKKIIYNSPVVLTFATVSLLSLLLGIVTDGASTTLFFTLFLTSPTDPLQYLRLFTHVLGHANWEHYANNMLLLLLTGPMLEEKYGSRRLLTVMVFTAVVTAIIHIMLFPETAVLGASGIVFAFILLTSITGSREGEIPLTLIIVAVIYLGGEILTGLFEDDSVSQLSHVIGGIIGCVFGYVFIGRDKKQNA